MKTSSKALLFSALLILVVMSLVFVMSLFRFQTTLTELVHSRLTVVSESIADSLEGAIDLGLSIEELQNADDLIFRARASDPGIEQIDIFNLNGEILFSTAAEPAGNMLDRDIQTARHTSQERTWGLDRSEVYVSGVTVTDSIGQPTGGVALTYSKASFDDKVRDLNASLLRNTPLIISLFFVLAYLGIRLGLREMDRYVDRVSSKRSMPIARSRDWGCCSIKSNSIHCSMRRK